MKVLPGIGLWLAVAVHAGCAADSPVQPDTRTPNATATVSLLGGGFVQCGDRRVPREAWMLDLRQRSRAQSAEQRAATRIVVRMVADAAEDAAVDRDWLLDQLQILGIGQVAIQ